MKLRKPRRERRLYRGYRYRTPYRPFLLGTPKIVEIFIEVLGKDKLTVYLCDGDFKLRSRGNEVWLYKRFVERRWGKAEDIIHRLLMDHDPFVKQAALAYLTTGAPVAISRQHYDKAV